MQITDLRVWLTVVPIEGVGSRTWVFPEVDTDEDITGIGEASSTGGGGSVVVGTMIRNLTDTRVVTDFRESLIGETPEDIVRTGGITETRKIANLAEVFHIPVTPHDANGPINIIAGAHTMMTVPNFYRLEIASGWIDNYNACTEPHLDIRDGYLYLSDRPGLGIEFNKDFLESHRDPVWQ